MKHHENHSLTTMPTAFSHISKMSTSIIAISPSPCLPFTINIKGNGNKRMGWDVSLRLSFTSRDKALSRRKVTKMF